MIFIFKLVPVINILFKEILENENDEEFVYLKQIQNRLKNIQKTKSFVHKFRYYIPKGKIILPEINKRIEEILKVNKNAFKLEISLGTLLKNIDGSFNYFHESNNTRIFEAKRLYHSRDDLKKRRDENVK